MNLVVGVIAIALLLLIAHRANQAAIKQTQYAENGNRSAL